MVIHLFIFDSLPEIPFKVGGTHVNVWWIDWTCGLIGYVRFIYSIQSVLTDAMNRTVVAL